MSQSEELPDYKLEENVHQSRKSIMTLLTALYDGLIISTILITFLRCSVIGFVWLKETPLVLDLLDTIDSDFKPIDDSWSPLMSTYTDGDYADLGEDITFISGENTFEQEIATPKGEYSIKVKIEEYDSNAKSDSLSKEKYVVTVEKNYQVNEYAQYNDVAQYTSESKSNKNLPATAEESYSRWESMEDSLLPGGETFDDIMNSIMDSKTDKDQGDQILDDAQAEDTKQSNMERKVQIRPRGLTGSFVQQMDTYITDESIENRYRNWLGRFQMMICLFTFSLATDMLIVRMYRTDSLLWNGFVSLFTVIFAMIQLGFNFVVLYQIRKEVALVCNDALSEMSWSIQSLMNIQSRNDTCFLMMTCYQRQVLIVLSLLFVAVAEVLFTRHFFKHAKYSKWVRNQDISKVTTV